MKQVADRAGLDEAVSLTADFLSDQEGAATQVRRETANIVTRYSFERGRLRGLALGKQRPDTAGNTVAGRVLYPAGRTGAMCS